jgi:hypothetical protein
VDDLSSYSLMFVQAWLYLIEARVGSLRRFKEREENYYQSILDYKRDTPNPYAMDIKVEAQHDARGANPCFISCCWMSSWIYYGLFPPTFSFRPLSRLACVCFSVC